MSWRHRVIDFAKRHLFGQEARYLKSVVSDSLGASGRGPEKGALVKKIDH